jgi:hypothetical protein
MGEEKLDCFSTSLEANGYGGRMKDIQNIVIASAARQSRASLTALDCFVAFAPRNDGAIVPDRNRGLSISA